MKKVCFVVPYFGTFKDGFQLFLNSCARNPKFNWLFLTDNAFDYDVPSNVEVVRTSFAQLARKIQSYFDFQINLSRPYKLCDYKPAYGYLFRELLKGYDFWGYCDTDLIWGDIGKFITDDVLDRFDKIGELGHCTVIRNSDRTNKAFLHSYGGTPRYQEVFQNEANCSFDEEYSSSINNIFNLMGVKIYPLDSQANLYTKSSFFRLIKLHSDHEYSIEPIVRGLFIWDRGTLTRWEKQEGHLFKQEYLYIHFQSRPMRVAEDLNPCKYKIIPNSFDDLEQSSVTNDNFYKIKKRHWNLHYFRLRFSNLVKKSQQLVKIRRDRLY